MNIDDLLRIATERKASDLHLKVGNYPHLRIDGELFPLTDQPRIAAEDMLGMAFSMMSARQKAKFKEVAEIDMAYGVAGLGRFRVNAMTAEELLKPVDFFGMFNFPAAMYLNFLFGHSVHHRGELAVYLRPMGSKCPSIYGPSADEDPMAA